ncbi:Interleukin-6 receptor subunit beta, partial [Nibea albiflora]
PNPKRRLFTCTTSENSCTAITKSTVRIRYCITVIAHTFSQNISSDCRCDSGRTEVMLDPVRLDSVKPVRGRPQCLNLTWISTLDEFPVAEHEVKHLKSQIEFTAQGQFNARVENVTSSNKSIVACLFRPDTSYTVRLRHRYKGPQSPWSQWSNAQRGRTGEDAPSVAPPFWRRVIQTDKNGRRLISLHWKPLTRLLANGRVLFFSVTCQTEGAQVLSDHENCSRLDNTSTSCSLHLPEGRCSCKLTASTSAGTSPEAQIWLLGASEAEPPPPRQITATPLDDNSFDVRWMAPVDRSPSGFVVEWFAVKHTEKNNNIPFWEKLNNSCKSLVITEGVKPMERFVVSVRALYGEQGAGQDVTVHVYTRQGAPTAGPKEVQVQKITDRTADIAWSPVPVELLHGFARNYTISYSKEDQQVKRVLVPAHVHRCSLKNLLPGNYIIYVQANTDAGPGKAGFTKMHIGEGSDEMSIVMYTLLPIMGTALALTLIACLVQSKMVKQKLCQDVPDPSDSSLAYWTPKTTLENMKWPVMTEMTEIKYSKVVLLGESELQNSSPDEDLTYHSVCDLQIYSTPCYSPRSVSRAQTAQNTVQPVKKCLTRAKTTSNADLSSCPSIYSSVLCSQTPQSPPTLLLDSTYQSNHWQHSTVSVDDVNLQLGGDSEPPASPQSATRAHSPLSEPDELKTFRCFLDRHQSPVCFSDFSSISHSSVLLSHPAEVTSPQDHFSQSIYKSVPALQPRTFTHTVALSDTFATSLSPFPQSLFVDFSYSPLKCDPYTSSTNHQ